MLHHSKYFTIKLDGLPFEPYQKKLTLGPHPQITHTAPPTKKKYPHGGWTSEKAEKAGKAELKVGWVLVEKAEKAEKAKKEEKSDLGEREGVVEKAEQGETADLGVGGGCLSKKQKK